MAVAWFLSDWYFRQISTKLGGWWPPAGSIAAEQYLFKALKEICVPKRGEEGRIRYPYYLRRKQLFVFQLNEGLQRIWLNFESYFDG
jgi:hypothetical protein